MLHMKILALVLLTGLAASAQTKPQPASIEYATPTIREEQTVVVNGVSETWRLQWKSAPEPYCEAQDKTQFWATCPCSRFAYGEKGDLHLVRIRSGTEVERLRLTPLFTETDDQAAIQRWPEQRDDLELSKRPDFSAIVSRRPVVQVMDFGDYDHDGNSTEFFLQTDAGPCGHHSGIVVGVSTNNPRLHVFGTVRRPRKPLYLEPDEWEKLRKASSAPVIVTHIQCGDHGSESEIDVRLNWSIEGIDGTRLEYSCPMGTHKARRLIRRWPLYSDQ